LINLYVQLTALDANNVKAWVDLAKLYADNGQKDLAINAAEQAIKADPSVTDYANQFINSLK
jgi:cytochrome c-type biogenesis protein CcmH/NrfG